MSKFRILSIDGGGFRGVYPAYILRQMESELSVNWREDFDLIAGTSTGSIIAAGLAMGKSATEILDVYETHGSDIFRKSRIPNKGIFWSRYSNSGLRAILSKLFGDTKLGDIDQPLILPSTDIGNGCVHVFKSTYHGDFLRDKNVLIADAVLASCSAPTYFTPSLITTNKKRYLLADGGLWANSPSLVAAIDAKRRLGAKLEDLKIISIGTGRANQFYPIKSFKNNRFIGWGFASKWGGAKFIEMLLNLQSENANNMLGLLLEKHQILQLNFESDKKLPLDSVDEFDNLITRADRQFTHKATVIRDFLKDADNYE